MTTNSSNSPKGKPQPNGYNPITVHDVANRSPSSWQDYFGELRAPVARCITAPLLFFLLAFSRTEPLAAPLALLILLGCLLFRLDDHTRQIAAVPLTLAAIKLAFQMATYLDSPARFISSQRNSSPDPGFIWLPMFFSACLIFIPLRDSVTFKIILAGSCALLASGLLPGQGFIAIFYVLDSLLFVAIVVGIVVDLKSYVPGQVQGSLRPAQ
jgi:hypothetical protein